MKNFFAKIPLAVFLIAGVLALLKILPIARAQWSTPPGWTYAGILSDSPDYMQYRVWMRQSLEEGPLVIDKFTAEPNKPHLFVITYFVMGKVAGILNVQPEFVYSYSGAFIVFLFTIFLFLTVRYFMDSGYQTWWVFLLTLLAGGLETHLGIFSNLSFVRQSTLLMNTLVRGFWSTPSFTDYRGHYTFTAIFDTHFILIWALLTVSLMCLLFTLREYSLSRLAFTLLFVSMSTLIHVYEGITLLSILVALGFLFYLKRLLDRSKLLILGLCFGTVMACLLIIFILQSRSGLPFPTWRELDVLFSSLLLAYPLAWLLIGTGFTSYWHEANINRVFLLGWALGCVIIVLSSPYYPYPNRGIVTLQIPLYIIAGQIYFSRRDRVSWPVAILVIVVAFLMPVWRVKNIFDRPGFNPALTAAFTTEDQEAIVSALVEKAGKDDLLIADMTKPEWESDLLWLGPKYPGRFYCGHFFLCVDFDRKRKEVIDFYGDNPEEKLNFIIENNIRFIYTSPEHDQSGFNSVSNLNKIIENPKGVIYEYLK